MLRHLLAVTLLLCPLVHAAPKIDGVIDEKEWAGAQRYPLTGGGDVLLLEQDEVLYVGVRGEKTGLASLCVGDGDRVSILHSSAALGTAGYARSGDQWQKKTDFTFEIRDSPRTGPPTEADKAKHFERWGWISNSSFQGSPVREYAIKLTPERQFLGVAFVEIEGDDMSVAYWPETVQDDCSALRLGQGWLGENQKFSPATWYRLTKK